MTLRRALISISLILTTLLALLAGCAGAGVCFRNSDCPSDYTCHSGVCVPDPTDGGAAVDEDGASGASGSQLPDAS